MIIIVFIYIRTYYIRTYYIRTDISLPSEFSNSKIISDSNTGGQASASGFPLRYTFCLHGNSHDHAQHPKDHSGLYESTEDRGDSHAEDRGDADDRS